MPPAYFLRQALGTGIGLLLLFVLAFGAITVLGRERWARLGLRESLFSRLAAAAVLASVGLSGATTVANLLISGIATSFLIGATTSTSDARAMDAARLQAAAGMVLALGVAAAIVTWIETYHRQAIGAISKEDSDEWIQEPAPPPVAMRPRGAPPPPGR